MAGDGFALMCTRSEQIFQPLPSLFPQDVFYLKCPCTTFFLLVQFVSFSAVLLTPLF